MNTLKLARIRLGEPGADRQLAELRARLGSQGNVVSARGRALTQKVFGEALPPVRVVERICTDVRNKGLSALLHYTEQLDKVRLTAETLRVSEDDLAMAHASADRGSRSTFWAPP